MSDERPGVVHRVFCGLWNALNFTRLLIFNLIFLAVLVTIVGAFFAARPSVAPHSALVLDPQGSIVDQYSTDPAQRALANLSGNESREVQLRDLLHAINAAAKDSRIDRMVLVPDDIASVGMATARDLGAALDRFRATGKQIIAVSGGMDQNQYLVAAHANTILLDPDGSVLLEGLANYRSYFKDALDKLGVEVHLIRVGTFKSAAEPYILNQASDAAKEADGYWMGGIWQGYLAEIAGLRKLDAATLGDDIAHYDDRVSAHQGDLARLALDEKLVDRLATRGEARALLRREGVAQGSEGFRQIDFQQYLATLGRDELPSRAPELAVIVAQGEIVAGEKPPGMIGGQSTAQLVRAARDDARIKAIVLRVNSPGGDAYASELIRREIAQTRAAGKPVIVSMGDVAASGGYWISMDADEIWAEPNTITGSIGIFGLFVTVPNALAKLGIHTDGVGTTPLAGALDVRRPMSPQLEAIMTSVIKRGYDEFIGNVAKARGQTPAQIDAIAQGRVWTGAQARQRGLVDKLGGIDDAIAAAAVRAKLGSNYQVRYIEPPLSMWERIALNLGNSSALAGFAHYAGFTLPSGLFSSAEIRQVAAIAESLHGKRYGAFAQCFCELR